VSDYRYVKFHQYGKVIAAVHATTDEIEAWVTMWREHTPCRLSIVSEDITSKNIKLGTADHFDLATVDRIEVCHV